MPWSSFPLNPGIIKDRTRYAAGNYWYDSSLVRFRAGVPERWSGWVKYNASFLMDGMCRSLHRWSNLNGFIYTSVGTNRRFYVTTDDSFSDVSPIASTANLNNPFDTTNGSPIVTVHDTDHGAVVGGILEITSSAPIAGLSINGEYLVTGYIDANTYQITASSNANANVTGGGGTVVIQYVYSAGSADQAFGGGWGVDTWGENEWGGSALSGIDRMGLWSQDNWGEDLVANVYDGPIFYWDATFPTNRMINIRNLPGADGFAPSLSRFIVVSHRDRHLLAFGVGEEFMGTEYAPMTVRWCSQEDIFNWDEADQNGTAGSLPLSRGSRFLAVQPTLQEILAWSDAAVYSLQFVGAPDVYIATIISESSDIAGLNARCAFGTTVYWMGRSGFYVYDGRVQKIPCPVWDYISRNVNWAQGNKIYCASSRSQGEVIWYYPSADSLENDSYVAYNVDENFWMVGVLPRTAWIDMDYQYQPLAASSDGYLYYHDIGMDDGSQNPSVPINAYIESAPIELSSEGAFNKGDRFAFIRRILPDITFVDNDQVNTPKMNIVLKMMNKPGGGIQSSSSSQVSQTAIIPVEEFTEECHVRLRGRSVTVRYESNTLGSQWRMGTPRFDIRTDGQR